MKSISILKAAALILLACIAWNAQADPPDYADSLDNVSPLEAGTSVPDASLIDMEGNAVSLVAVLDAKPTVLIFFRGGWCPFCTKQLAELEEIRGDIADAGFQIVAISPDSIKSMADAATEHELGYTLLCDREMKAISAFGLAFALDAETLEAYRGYGIKLQRTPDTKDKVLPVPAVYVVDAGGQIVFAHTDPDYRERLGADKVLAAVRDVTGESSGPPVATSRIEYRDGETVLRGYVAYREDLSERRPGVVVFPEWWGQNGYARRRARQLAALGYVGFAADIYGDGQVVATAEEAGALAGIYKGDRELMRQRCRAATDALARLPQVDPLRLAAIGYCFGGTCALELARSGAGVRGVVSFHGGLDASPTLERGPVLTRVLVCHGADDPHVPAEDLAALKNELREAGADWQLVEYGGAVHSFTNPDSGDDPSKGVAYNPLADARSWEHMRLFLVECFR